MSRRNQTRTYTKHKHNGKMILVSWIQGRCKLCGKFLGIQGKKYCPRCYIKTQRQWTTEHRRNRSVFRRDI